MVAPVRSNRVAFRRAVAASVAVHVALAVAVVVVVRSGPDARPAKIGIDTRAHDVVVRVSLDEPLVTTRPPDDPPSAPAVEPPAAQPEATGSAGPPLAGLVSPSLPDQVLALVRRSAASAITDPNVTPA